MSDAHPSYRTVQAPDGHLSVSPLPDQAELEAFYRRTYYSERPSESYQAAYSDAELAYKRWIAAQILYALAESGARPQAGPLLEIGCGEGFGLAAGEVAGWRVQGIELSDEAVRRFHPAFAERVVVEDLHAALARFAGQGRRFGALVLQNVLEHVREPRRVLEEAAEVMAPDARMAVTLPNDESAVQHALLAAGDVAERYWVVPPQHLHYFDIATGTAFAEAAGYRVRDLYSDFPIEVFLFHPGSNYVRDRDQGRAAHHARVRLTALMADKGMEAFHELCRAQARCGLGRAFTLILERGGR